MLAGQLDPQRDIHSANLRGLPGPAAEIEGKARQYWYPQESRTEAETQWLLYTGRGRHLVAHYLAKLGMGIQEDQYPLQVGLLQYVVSQLAVAYRSPPTRYLRRPSGSRYGDTSAAQKLAWDAYRDSKVDAILREVDRRRSLFRTCFVRLYASDTSRRVRLAIYPPTAVFRDTDGAEPEDLRADERIALKRSDKSSEVFEQFGDGWRMTLYREDGEQEATELYTELPLIPFFDGLPDTPYLHPYQWRSEFVMKLGLSANEVGAAVMYDVHPRATLESTPLPPGGAPPAGKRDPVNVGPSQLATLDPGERMVIHQLQPQIAAINAATRETIELWFRAESLPTDSFRQSQTVSALGLQTLAAPLRERREDLMPFVVESEELLWRAYRALHNQHAGRWERESLAEDAEMDVVLGDVDVPIDPAAHSQQLAIDQQLRLTSPIDALMSRHGISRAEAVERRKQIDADFEAYALEDPGAAVEGERPADPDPSEEEMNPAASTAQAARQEMMSATPDGIART